MTYSKEELLKNAAPYFAQGAKVMFATEDGNYFYPEHKKYADGHKSISGSQLFELSKEDFEALTPEIKEEPVKSKKVKADPEIKEEPKKEGE